MRASRMWYALCLCLIVLLIGCGNQQSQQFFTLSRLHAPNLQWLAVPSRIPLKDGVHGGVLLGLATFQPAGSSVPQVAMNFLGTTIDHTELHTIGLDGSHPHLINVEDGCGPFAIPVDGQWIICADDGRLDQIARLSSNGVAAVHQVHLPGDNNTIFTWSPDGRYFAVVDSSEVSTCSINVFSSQPPYTTFSKVATIASDMFNLLDRCDINGLSWSANGKYLLIGTASVCCETASGEPTTNGEAFTAVSTAFLSQAGNAAGAQPPTITIPRKQFAIASAEALSLGWNLTIAWNLDNTTVVFASTADISNMQRDTLVSFDLHTHLLTTLLVMPDQAHHVQSMAWTPDGRHLLFAVGFFCREDCPQRADALSDVYEFTPPAS